MGQVLYRSCSRCGYAEPRTRDNQTYPPAGSHEKNSRATAADLQALHTGLLRAKGATFSSGTDADLAWWTVLRGACLTNKFSTQSEGSTRMATLTGTHAGSSIRRTATKV